jgi:hypothetical protein
MDVAAKLQWEVGWVDAVLCCQQHERRLDNHMNKRTNSRTLRRYLDSGFAKRFYDTLGLRPGLAVRNMESYECRQAAQCHYKHEMSARFRDSVSTLL